MKHILIYNSAFFLYLVTWSDRSQPMEKESQLVQQEIDILNATVYINIERQHWQLWTFLWANLGFNV